MSESEYVEKGTWVGDNPEFYDIRARIMQGGYSQKGMHTHMYMLHTCGGVAPLTCTCYIYSGSITLAHTYVHITYTGGVTPLHTYVHVTQTVGGQS